MARRLSLPLRRPGAHAPRQAQDDHIRDLIEQVLFTSPGERVNRPDLRQRAAAAGLRAERRALGRRDPVRRAGRAAAVAGRPDPGRCRHRLRPGRDAPHRGPVHRAPHPGAAQRPVHQAGSGLMRYVCCDERRREAVSATNLLNGIDFLEVVDRAADPAERQRRLRIQFLKPPAGALLTVTAANIRITGGARVTGITVEEIVGWTGEVLEVRVDRRGDYATYTLAFVTTGGLPLPGLDPSLAAVDFSFKIECPTDFDCQVDCACQTESEDAPEIDYLARDYTSFRRLILDRLAAINPDWQERNPSDLGVASGRGAELRGRSPQLPARRRRHGGHAGDRAPPRFGGAPRPDGRLPHEPRRQRQGLGPGPARRRRRRSRAALPHQAADTCPRRRGRDYRPWLAGLPPCPRRRRDRLRDDGRPAPLHGA